MEKPGLLDLQEKRGLVVFVETMDLLVNKESGDQQDRLAARETKGTLERTDPRSVDVIIKTLQPPHSALNRTFQMSKSVAAATALFSLQGTLFGLIETKCSVAITNKGKLNFPYLPH